MKRQEGSVVLGVVAMMGKKGQMVKIISHTFIITLLLNIIYSSFL